MSSSLLISVLFGALSVSSISTYQEPEKIKDVEELRRSIEANTMSLAERKSLHLDCQDQASLTYVSLLKGEHQAILQAFGNGCSSERVLLMLEGGAGNWTLRSELRVSSHYYEQPTVTFPSLVEPGVQEIMVEHQIADWGTGVLEKFTTIYKWIDGHFRVVFDEPDFIHLEEWSGDSLYDFDQTSTFKVEMDKQTSAKMLEERKTIALGKRKIVLNRDWIWEPSLQRFRGFASVP